MIEKFVEFNGEGIEVPYNLTYPLSKKDMSKELYLKYINSPSRQGIAWVHDGKEIKIKDDKASIQGFPTTDMNYVVAVYLGLDGEFKPPRNAVIYNLDGSIRKVLEIPSFISDKLCKRLSFLEQENPPLSWAAYEGQLFFGGFGWYKKDDGKVVNFISIVMERESFEQRELDPQTGIFGECLGSGLAQYARIE